MTDFQHIIRDVKDQKSFIQKLLLGGLGWRIDEGVTDLDDISYDWTEKELNARGFEKRLVEGKVRQIRPLEENNSWGIFVLEFTNPDVFTKGRGMTGVLRQVLRYFVNARKAKVNFAREQMLFICTHNYQHFSFAYFRKPLVEGNAPPIAQFGWEPNATARTVCDYNLPQLRWPTDETDTAKWIKNWAQAFDVEKVTKRFYDEYEGIFKQFEDRVKGPVMDENRRMFVQTLFNRLMFIRFIERKGWVKFNGREDYLKALCESKGLGEDTLFKSRLCPLFFEGFATKDVKNPTVYGEVPFLNGGLFEKGRYDFDSLDVPDELFKYVIGPEGLFYRYNFTVEESTPVDINVAVDPEMLGKVFEKLVTGRHESGSYYTPRTIVSFMCKESLKGYLGQKYETLVEEHKGDNIVLKEAEALLEKLQEVRIVDPACGSGAYLLGMLHELDAINKILDTKRKDRTPRDNYNRRLDIIQYNLYGVDKDDFAATIARLRLWLALAVEFDGDRPLPLPNLDYKVERGDSLTAPDPQGNQELAHNIIVEFGRLKKDHGRAFETELKSDLARKISALREDIAKWVRTGQKVDGFDWGVDFAEVFLPRTPNATIDGEIVLGDKLASQPEPGGFDIVLANPPYGLECKDPLRFNFFPKDETGKEEPQSQDSYGLFMARALQLLRKGGFFTYIVSDTWRTIRKHRPLRKHLLSRSRVLHLIDLPPWIFDATVNTCIITAQKKARAENHMLIAADLRNLPSNQWSTLDANLRAIAGKGVDLQTTEYARYTYPQSLIEKWHHLPFFIGSPGMFERLFSGSSSPLGKTYVRVRGNKSWSRAGECYIISGIKTGRNAKYIRRLNATVEGNGLAIVDPKKIVSAMNLAKLSQEEKLNGLKDNDVCFVPLDKGGASDVAGGWLPNYWVPTQYYIDWSHDAVKSMQREKHSDLANAEFRFLKGITFSRTGDYAPTFRYSAGGILESKSCGLFPAEVDIETLLAILCSRVIKYLLKSFIMSSVETSVGTIGFVPLILPEAGLREQLRECVSQIVSKQMLNLDYSYASDEQVTIDNIVQDLYSISADEQRDIELWYCRRYPRLAEAQGFTTEVKEKYADYLAHCEFVMSKSPAYWKSHPVLTLIAQGEGPQLEFKETLEHDIKTGQRNQEVVKSTLKTFAAFLNSSGGTLMLGVSDSGEIKGLESDLALCNKRDKDGFEQKLRNLIDSRFEPKPHHKIETHFDQLTDGMICRVVVQASNDITHFDKEVYIRDGNTTRKLDGPALTKWIQSRGVNK